MLSTTTQIIEGQGWYLIDILEEVKRLTMITTHLVERFHEDVIDQRWHQAKGIVKRKVIGITEKKQDQNQSCLSRQII
jgi:hypothetical protein